MRLGKLQIGTFPLPLNWRDWRFGFVVRAPRSYGTDVDIGIGPFAFTLFWRRWS